MTKQNRIHRTVCRNHQVLKKIIKNCQRAGFKRKPVHTRKFMAQQRKTRKAIMLKETVKVWRNVR